MFCTKCGKEIKGNNKFCAYCGAEILPDIEPSADIQESYPETEPNREVSSGRSGLKIAVALLIIVFILLIVFGVFFAIKMLSDKNPEKPAEAIEENGAETFEADTTDAEGRLDEYVDEAAAEESDSEIVQYEVVADIAEDADEKTEASEKDEKIIRSNSNDDFGIDEDNSADYKNVLNFSDFGYYESENGIDLFSFYYPKNLYNNVRKDTSITDGNYGENEETILFDGDDGSSLQYIVTNRTDDAELKEAAEYVYNYEEGSLDEATDISPLKFDEERGFFIITGREASDNDKLVYDMLRIDDTHVYQMKVVFPDYENDEDKDRKGYYAECLYRSCGFSNSSKDVRSYEEYLGEN